MQRAGERTFPMDPQQRTGLFPILEGSTLGEPHTGAFMMSITSSVVIYVWIWRLEPICEVLPELIPCIQVESLRQRRNSYEVTNASGRRHRLRLGEVLF
jgi:hypothetical protein